MGPMEIFWLAAAIFFLVVEAATPALVSIWFALGAFVALLTAFFGAQLWIQILVFLVVSAIALVATRPLAKKYLDKKHIPTNADMVIGKEGVVTEEIDNLNAHGAVSCQGKVWTARSAGGESIPAKTKVTVDAIEGVKLIVSPAEDSAK